MLKKTRKQRTVKGRYVDIDSVKEECGDNFSNWISITKHKLKERESKLLQIKINTTEAAVNQAISKQNITSSSNNIPFRISEKAHQETLKNLFIKIDQWNGVNTSRTKSTLKEYRDYFTVAKKWFDSAKKKQIGKVYWLFVLQQIKQLPLTTQLHLHIIKALFHGTIKYNNTKTQSLISGGSIMCSEELQQFLLNLHPTLKIKEWIKEQKMSRSYQQNSSKLIDKIQSQMCAILNLQNIEINTNKNVYTNPNTYVNPVNASYTANSNANMYQYNGVHTGVSNPTSGVRYTPLIGHINRTYLPYKQLPNITIPIVNNNNVVRTQNMVYNNNNNNNNTYAIVINQTGNNPQIYFV